MWPGKVLSTFDSKDLKQEAGTRQAPAAHQSSSHLTQPLTTLSQEQPHLSCYSPKMRLIWRISVWVGSQLLHKESMTDCLLTVLDSGSSSACSPPLPSVILSAVVFPCLMSQSRK